MKISNEGIDGACDTIIERIWRDSTGICHAINWSVDSSFRHSFENTLRYVFEERTHGSGYWWPIGRYENPQENSPRLIAVDLLREWIKSEGFYEN